MTNVFYMIKFIETLNSFKQLSSYVLWLWYCKISGSCLDCFQCKYNEQSDCKECYTWWPRVLRQTDHMLLIHDDRFYESF